MVCNRFWSNKNKLLPLSISVLLGLGAEVGLAADSFYQQGASTKVMGKTTGAKLVAGNSVGTNTVSTKTTISVLGIALQALMAFASPPNTINGATYNEYYSFGKRVFSESTQITQDQSGPINISLGLAPTEVRVPAVVFPLGPITLEIDGGARFLANVKTQLTPTLLLPDFSLSSLNIQLQANVMGAGFMEGYASFLVIRGGVGGQLDLIDAHAFVNGLYFFDGSKATFSVSAIVEFLKGRIYAFIDYFSLWGFEFRRLWDTDLYNWAGYCYSTGESTCPAQ